LLRCHAFQWSTTTIDHAPLDLVARKTRPPPERGPLRIPVWRVTTSGCSTRIATILALTPRCRATSRSISSRSAMDSCGFKCGSNGLSSVAGNATRETSARRNIGSVPAWRGRSIAAARYLLAEWTLLLATDQSRLYNPRISSDAGIEDSAASRKQPTPGPATAGSARCHPPPPARSLTARSGTMTTKAATREEMRGGSAGTELTTAPSTRTCRGRTSRLAGSLAPH
jgi:hypothetical protein